MKSPIVPVSLIFMSFVYKIANIIIIVILLFKHLYLELPLLTPL